MITFESKLNSVLLTPYNVITIGENGPWHPTKHRTGQRVTVDMPYEVIHDIIHEAPNVTDGLCDVIIGLLHEARRVLTQYIKKHTDVLSNNPVFGEAVKGVIASFASKRVSELLTSMRRSKKVQTLFLGLERISRSIDMSTGAMMHTISTREYDLMAPERQFARDIRNISGKYADCFREIWDNYSDFKPDRRQ